MVLCKHNIEFAEEYILQHPNQSIFPQKFQVWALKFNEICDFSGAVSEVMRCFLPEMSALIFSAFGQYLSVGQTSCLWVRLSAWDEVVASDNVVSEHNHAAVTLKASAGLFATQVPTTLEGCTSARFPSLELLDGLFC